MIPRVPRAVRPLDCPRQASFLPGNMLVQNGRLLGALLPCYFLASPLSVGMQNMSVCRAATVPAGGVAEKCGVPLKCVPSTRHRGRDGVWLEESGRGVCRQNIAVALASCVNCL